ncbi:RtcB family protein [Candidatus Woesearchaeota archaeon]|nr:RtcB family protein [Candidatus Woesearchaeota archaeon]
MVSPKQENEYSYIIPKEGNMNVPVRVFASNMLMEHLLKDKSLQQGMNVACLPGIRKESLMMPDAHQGYGFSIGGVAAFSMQDGIISPGGVGFDINCGVRLITTSLTKDEVEPRISELLDKLFQAIPSGKGFESKERLSDEELDAILKEGPAHLVSQGIGTAEDIAHCEGNGRMPEANSDFISPRAKARGRRQLGTLGAGNHFLEIQYVGEIFDNETAKTFGITKVNQVVFMIHCGSRGLGHQVASDYLRKMEDEYPDVIAALPEKDLVYAPITSKLGKEYYGAMCAAANFAWANRHMIGHQAKEVFKEFFPDAIFKTMYDVAHNIAKKETHVIDGKEEEVMVHRKGATRAFGPGSEDLPADYQTVGQPVIIPGSMGTSSYVLVGTKEGMTVSFGSTAHGAGRLMSRFAAKKEYDGEQVKEDLAKHHITLRARSVKGVGDEAPGAYKDVDEVVNVSHKAHIGNLVAKLKPLGVIKG